MIEVLKRQLEEEKRKKRDVVNILDKRIKCLEKAINGIESYNNQSEDVKSVLEDYEVEKIGEEYCED